MRPSEAQPRVPLAAELPWVQARLQMFAHCAEQGCPVEGSLVEAARLSKTNSISLRCAKHGQFTLRLGSLRQALTRKVCPACHEEHRTGTAVPDNASLAARRGTERHFVARSAARLQAAQQRLDTQFGDGVLDLGDDPYDGERQARSVLCLRDKAHGGFETTTRSLGRLRSRHPCPHCREEAYLRETSAPCIPLRPGGYLYVITDAKTTLRYFGLTASTPEQRYEGHLRAAAGSARQPLYQAMRERPEDFKLAPYAYYYNVCDLAKAEREVIAEQKTRWPNGYNMTGGGEYAGPNKSALKKLRCAVDLTNEAMSDEVRKAITAAALHLFKQGASMPRVTRLIRNGLTAQELLAVDPTDGAPPNKFQGFTVHGVLYADGLVKACKALKVCSKSVRRKIKVEGLDTGPALERLLDEQSAAALVRVVIDGNSYSSYAQAKRETGLSARELKMREKGISPVQKPPSARVAAQQLGLPRDAYRQVAHLNLVAAQIAELRHNLKALQAPEDTQPVMLSGQTYENFSRFRQEVALDPRLAAAVLRCKMTLADAQTRQAANDQKRRAIRKDDQQRRSATRMSYRAAPPSDAQACKAARRHTGAEALRIAAWGRFQHQAQAFYEEHGHLRISVRLGASKDFKSASERVRERWKCGELDESQIAWLTERDYCFDALGEQNARRAKALELVTRLCTQPLTLTEMERRGAKQQVNDWLRSATTGELSPLVRQALAPLDVDWRFSALTFDLPTFEVWCSRLQASPEDKWSIQETAWVSFVRQCHRRKTLPAACAHALANRGMASLLP